MNREKGAPVGDRNGMNTLSKSDGMIVREIDADQLACVFGTLLTSLLGEAQVPRSKFHRDSSLLSPACRNARLRRRPACIEWMAGAVDVDDHRCVIRGQRFSLPRLAIDLGPDHAVS